MGDRQAAHRAGEPAVILLLALLILGPAPGPPRVITGADVLLERRLSLVAGKRVGLITNPTGRLSSGEMLLDALVRKGVNVTALFGPEHGIRGTSGAGETVADSLDRETGIPVYSLYGPTRKPTRAMLEHVDVLVYDMQDVGARFYTFLSTMGLCMEAAAEEGLPFIVLDRPDPLGGDLTDGPVLPDSLRSFVGMFPIPVVYGLTVGELASMANGEGWLRGGERADLTVVRMEGWTRGMRWVQTGLPWYPPSPNIRRPGTESIYPATCYLEATNVSEGRGTGDPFHIIGAPFVPAGRFSRLLSAGYHDGIAVSDTEFVPGESKYRGVRCRGVHIDAVSDDSLRPVRAGVEILSALVHSCGDSLHVNPKGLARLLGDAEALGLIGQGKSSVEIASRWERGLQSFREKSKKYFAYPER
ncbi:MAG TPA: DUF1343 domain-containing protein [Bacteroidota bacterium]|nr:DUF1343 domain-containing protein [Bacteroidota bacterium]